MTFPLSRLALCLLGAALGSAAVFRAYMPVFDKERELLSGQSSAESSFSEAGSLDASGPADSTPDHLAVLNEALNITQRAQRAARVAEALRRWAWADPDAVFAWLESADNSLLGYASDALEVLILADPGRVALLSQRLSRGYQFGFVLTQAVAELTERDRNAAISRMNALPAGQEYRAWRQGVANGYVAHDPVGALSWAQSLNPAAPEAVTAVMSAIRNRDIELGFELAVASIASGNSTGMDSMSWMTRNDSADSATMARIGERIATLPSEQAGLLAWRFGEAWSVSAPVDALDWALEHWSVGAMMIGNIAINMRGNSTEQTVAIAGQLPTGNRNQWLRTSISLNALEMFGEDPAALPGYLSQFEREPFYDGLIDALARNVVLSPIRQSDPASIQRALESLPDGELRQALQQAIEENS